MSPCLSFHSGSWTTPLIWRPLWLTMPLPVPSRCGARSHPSLSQGSSTALQISWFRLGKQVSCRNGLMPFTELCHLPIHVSGTDEVVFHIWASFKTSLGITTFLQFPRSWRSLPIWRERWTPGTCLPTRRGHAGWCSLWWWWVLDSWSWTR